MNNESTMATLIEELKTIHAASAYVKQMTEQAKKVAELEIKLRYHHLRAKLYKLLDQCARARLFIAEIAEETPAGTLQHISENHIHLTVYGVLKSATQAVADLLKMENGTKLAAGYKEACGFDWTGLDSLATDDGDYVRVKHIITLMETWMPILQCGLKKMQRIVTV
jgi:hypothetical protein